MKNFLIYFLILIAGLLLGYMIFSNNEDEQTHQHEEAETSKMWTCSMHPQIMQTEPGDCPVCGMELIPASATSDGLSAEEFSMTETAMKLANIQTTVVGQGSGIDASITLSGKIEVNEDENAVMSAHFNGRVEKLFANTVGDRVSRGQIVASVYSPELVAAQQELITAAKLKESQPELYNAVRNKFKIWMIKDKVLDKVESTGNVQTSLPIYSHVNGTVTEIMVEEGSHIMDGMPILKVANLNSVWAVFDAYEPQISNLKEGQNLKINVNAIPDEDFSGKISFIDPILNDDSRTIEVRVVLNNNENRLKPGMFVEAKAESSFSDSQGQNLEIPRSAVLWTGERSLVYVKTGGDQPTFEMREVKLGNSTGENFQVLNGLEAGEEIVTNGTFTVDAAAQLQGKRSMMNNAKSKENKIAEVKMHFPKSFQLQFVKTLEDYFRLKDALVDSQPEQAIKEAKSYLQRLPENDLPETSSGHYNKVIKMLEAISKNDDLENQRAHFVNLSENIIVLTSNIDSLGKTVYVQHCPMANSNKGADWLSQSSEIRNPYYGEAMLTCGEVTGILE
ncbi:efflux RND transporter periplasmic adaptor subunit [Gramella lutea]|uniref:Efflux RND transporter periplasmic adaptor subunit n=1 Tax=Christiangramia lutea TaxID=1607951 RepID=A0A9X1V4N8_9FLAO|nr:efflux RND transporter periplasmic adaptor subunit [Christiangramia lutea]MCH4824522.1 efflux RND transporter periplasmic adaptor subunit [Christiangramia lutea]